MNLGDEKRMMNIVQLNTIWLVSLNHSNLGETALVQEVTADLLSHSKMLHYFDILLFFHISTGCSKKLAILKSTFFLFLYRDFIYLEIESIENSMKLIISS